jgi:hypothetical protein
MLLEELREAFVALRRDELDARLADRQEDGLGLLRFDDLAHGRVEAEDFFVFCTCCIDIRDGDGNVVDLLDSHVATIAQESGVGQLDPGASPWQRIVHRVNDWAHTVYAVNNVLPVRSVVRDGRHRLRLALRH